MNFLLYAPEAATTGKALVEYMQQQGAEIIGGTDPPKEKMSVLIRYGSRKSLGIKHGKVIQRADAIASAGDKLQTLQTLLENCIQSHPLIWTQNSPGLTFPCIGRRIEHSHGTDIKLCLSRLDMELAIQEGSQYFVEFLPIKTEWRIHVVNGKRIRTSIKYLDEPSKRVPWMRNFDTGWKFRHPENAEEKPPAKAQLSAKYAVDMLGLNFGAVDLAVTDDGQVVIFEVNTAPGLATSDQGVQLYAKALMQEL